MRSTDGTVDIDALLKHMNHRHFRNAKGFAQLPQFTTETLMRLVKSDNGRHFHTKLRWPLTVPEYRARKNGPGADQFYQFCCENPNFAYIALGSPTGYSVKDVSAEELALGVYEGNPPPLPRYPGGVR